MTSLRTALREACDTLDATALRHVGEVRERVDRWRSLADAPLTVLDALRDPEVRAGKSIVEYESDGGISHQLRVFHREIEGRWRADGRAFGSWYCEPLLLADLDTPCRLVPAEGDRG